MLNVLASTTLSLKRWSQLYLLSWLQGNHMMFTCIEWAHLFWQSLPRTMKCGVCPWRVANSENVGRATGTYTCIYIYRFIIHSLWALSESRWHTSQIIRYYCSIDFGINKNCAYLRFRVTEGSFLRHLAFPITFLAIWTVRTSGDFHQNVGAFGRQSFPCLSNDAPMRTHRNTRQSKVHVASLAMTGKSTGVRSCH